MTQLGGLLAAFLYGFCPCCSSPAFLRTECGVARRARTNLRALNLGNAAETSTET